MASTPEGKVKDKVKKFLKSINGIFYFMPVQGKFANPGIPDFILSYRGKFIGVETKAPGKKDDTTEKQKIALKNIVDSGGYSLVIDGDDGINELKDIFKNIDITIDNSV